MATWPIVHVPGNDLPEWDHMHSIIYCYTFGYKIMIIAIKWHNRVAETVVQNKPLSGQEILR